MDSFYFFQTLLICERLFNPLKKTSYLPSSIVRIVQHYYLFFKEFEEKMFPNWPNDWSSTWPCRFRFLIVGTNAKERANFLKTYLFFLRKRKFSKIILLHGENCHEYDCVENVEKYSNIRDLEFYLENRISLIQQLPHPEIELIIVDNASSDSDSRCALRRLMYHGLQYGVDFIIATETVFFARESHFGIAIFLSSCTDACIKKLYDTFRIYAPLLNIGGAKLEHFRCYIKLKLDECKFNKFVPLALS
jgi:hypothetical protein